MQAAIGVCAALVLGFTECDITEQYLRLTAATLLQVIWSNQMRAEVLEALAAQRAETGPAPPGAVAPDGGDFRFASLEVGCPQLYTQSIQRRMGHSAYKSDVPSP